MKILLINPVIIRKDFNFTIYVEPLGLEYLAAMLLDEHEVEILDGLPTGLTYEEIINTIKNFQPDIIGISVAYSICIKIAEELAEVIKKSFPDKLIVLGGNSATFNAEYLIKSPFIDIIVKGEGEITFKELVNKLKIKNYGLQIKELESVAGLCYKTPNGDVKFTPKRQGIEDLDTLPFPAHSILKNKIYYERTIFSGRGCPYGCIYCSTSAFFGKYRKRSIESIIKEVETLFNPDLVYQTDNIIFIDDNFTIDIPRVKEFCKQITSLNEKLNLDKKLTWGCNGRIENMTEDLLITLRDAGCNSLFLGVESGSSKTLNFLKRKYTPDDVIKVTTLCKQLGIHTITAFIIGLPFETQEDLDQTFYLIEKIPDMSGVCILTAFPGTPVFNEPQKYGLTIFPHLPEEDNLNQCAWVSTKFLTKEDVISAYYKAIGICIRKAKKFSLV